MDLSDLSISCQLLHTVLCFFQAIECTLVISASNADPKRTFSTITRLTEGERSNSGTEILDNMM
ncbi:hypothetical protein GCK32_003450, partial [Trichostrongylus colubriformis]